MAARQLIHQFFDCGTQIGFVFDDTRQEMPDGSVKYGPATRCHYTADRFALMDNVMKAVNDLLATAAGVGTEATTPAVTGK